MLNAHTTMLDINTSESLFSTVGNTSRKESICNAGDTGDVGLIPGLGRSPGVTPPVFLPGESHGQMNLTDCSP